LGDDNIQYEVQPNPMTGRSLTAGDGLVNIKIFTEGNAALMEGREIRGAWAEIHPTKL